MSSKIVVSLVFLAFFTAVGGFIALSVWDVQVPRSTVEKQVDASRFLNKKS